MKKKWLPFLLIAAAILLLISCNSKKPPEKTDNGNSNGSTAVFSVDSLNVYLYESVPLPLLDGIELAELSYSSTDTSIAVVENSTIKTLSAGTAKIAASVAGNEQDTLIVNVIDDGNVPFLTVSQDSLSIFDGTSYQIEAKVMLRGNEEPARYSYVSSDPEVVSVNDSGVVTSHKTGAARINVSAEIPGYAGLDALKRTVTVEVLPVVVIDISSEKTVISTRADLINGIEFSNETGVSGSLLTKSGVTDLSKLNCEWVSSDPAVASVENSRIVGHKLGKAVIYARVSTDYGVFTSNHIEISVEKPTIDVVEASFDIDMSEDRIDLPTDYMLNGDSAILNIFDNDDLKTSIYKDQSITDYEHLGPRTWIVESDRNNYRIHVVVCSKIITTKDELAALHLYGKNVVKGDKGIISYEGYFILGADIDMAGTRFRTFCGNATGAASAANSGFIGVFDGRGHTVLNAGVAANDSGLFPTLNKNSIVKNVAFRNASVTGSSGLISSVCGGVIDNVFVEGKLNCLRATADSPASLLASKIYDGAVISRCIVKVTNPAVNNKYSAAIGALVSAKEDALKNVYVLGTVSKSLATSVGDKYSKLKNDGNGQFENYSELLKENLSAFSEHWNFGETGIGFTVDGKDHGTDHTHQISEQWVSSADKHWHTCSGCEARFDEAPHAFGAWQIVKPASETSTGLEKRICAVCLYEDTREIPKTQHTHKFEIRYDENYHWTECSCGEKTEKEAHYGGTATETARAVCEVCHQPYGEAGIWGDVYFGNISIRGNGFDGVSIRPYFTNPEKCKDEVFEFFVENESVAYIENGKAYFLSLGETTVTAKSAHFEKTFKILAEEFPSMSRATTQINRVANGYEGNETLFIGDSFFEFWRDGTNGVKTFDQVFSEYKVFNIGLSGYRTHEWRSMHDKLFKKAKAPKNIVINLGINNINIKLEDGKTCAYNLMALIDDYLEQYPETNIYYCSITRCHGVHEDKWIHCAESNRILKEYCDQNDRLHYIDIIGAFGENYADYLISDGLHPNQKGYDVFEKMILEAVPLDKKS